MSKDLYLEVGKKEVFENELANNLDLISEDEFLKKKGYFKNIRRINDIFEDLDRIPVDTYENIYIGDKRIAFLGEEELHESRKFKIDTENSDYFSNEFGIGMSVCTFRFEKTNLKDNEYSLYCQKGNSKEVPILNNKGTTFKANNDQDFLNKMEEVITGKHINTQYKYDDGVTIKAAVIIEGHDKRPLFLMQGNRKVDNDYAIDEFANNFPSNIQQSISNFTPKYKGLGVTIGNQEKVEGAINDLLSETSPEDFESVMDLLQRKHNDLNKNKAKVNSMKNR
jgi:hypothetical protein